MDLMKLVNQVKILDKELDKSGNFNTRMRALRIELTEALEKEGVIITLKSGEEIEPINYGTSWWGRGEGSVGYEDDPTQGISRSFAISDIVSIETKKILRSAGFDKKLAEFYKKMGS